MMVMEKDDETWLYCCSEEKGKILLYRSRNGWTGMRIRLSTRAISMWVDPTVTFFDGKYYGRLQQSETDEAAYINKSVFGFSLIQIV